MADLKSWEWTGRREQAALLVAEDALSEGDIAARVRLTREGLRKWKRRPEFRERVAAIREQMRQAIVARGIAELQNRVDALNARWELMRQVIQARAEAGPSTAPGAKTGLLVKTVKAIGTGKNQYEVEEWAVDTGLLRELRAHEEQAAKELGQWTERRQVSLSVDELDAAIERELARLAAGGEAVAAGAASRAAGGVAGQLPPVPDDILGSA